MVSRHELEARFAQYESSGLLTGSQLETLLGWLREGDVIPLWLTEFAQACEKREKGSLGSRQFEEIKERVFRNAQSPDDRIVHEGMLHVHPVGVEADSEEKAQNLVRNCALVAAFIGLVPLPVADAPFLIVTQFVMLSKLCALYGRKPGLSLVLIVLSALIGPILFDAFVKLIPVAGSIIGAAVAGGLTWFIGTKVKIMLAKAQDFNWQNFLKAKITR